MKSLKIIIAVIIITKLLIIFSGSLHACSPNKGYLKPSNYDLVKEADAILLAETVSFSEKKEIDEYSTFRFRVIEVLKGNFIDSSFKHEGYNQNYEPSDENDFSYRRSGLIGSCNSNIYQVGKKYLLFLMETKYGWRINGPTYTRINEEVRNINSPWVTAVKHYICISRLEDYESEKTALKKLQDKALIGKNPDKYPPGLIKDIDVYLNRPYFTKSYQDLMELYRNSSSNHERGNVLWAFAKGEHPEAKSLIHSLLQSGEWKNHIVPISEYIARTKDNGTIKILASAYSDFSIVRFYHDRWSIMGALIKIADDKDSGLMLSILKSSIEEEAERLCFWFVKHPSKEATKIIKKMVGNQYQEKWKLAFGLAALGDDNVLRWAREFIKSSNEDRWMGFSVIAQSPLAEADELAKSIIHGSDQKAIVWLIQEYEDSFNPNKWNRLRDIINLKIKNNEVEYWLRITLEDMAAAGDRRAAELIRTMN